jgi:hypothetical protein
MCDERWGVGDKADAKAFDRTKVRNEEVELIFGEHPHSRQDNNIYARFPDGTIEGFNGHRLLHEIHFKDYNYLKTSGMSGNEVRRGGTCQITINGSVVAEFFYRDIDYALLEARQRLAKIVDHPMRLWDQDEREGIIGRKVYWHDQPGIIKYLTKDGGVIIAPDYPDGSGFRPIAYMIEDNEDYEERDIKDNLFSHSINWFRK